MTAEIHKPTGDYLMTREEYDRVHYLNCSRLKIALRSTRHLSFEQVTESDTHFTNKAFAFGSAFHTFCLEPHLFADECAVCPSVDRRTKIGKETWAKFKEAAGEKIVIQENEVERMDDMRDTLINHPVAADLLFGGNVEYERTLISNPNDIGSGSSLTPDALKGRVDVLRKHSNIMVDLKTCQDASPDAVRRTVLSFGYHVQAAFYSRLYKDVYHENPAFFFAFIEKEPPHGVLVVSLDDDWMDYGEAECDRGIQSVREWTTFGPNHYNEGTSLVLSAPSFIKNRIGETHASNH